MSYIILEKRQSFGINKAFIKQTIFKDDIEKFSKALNQLKKNIKTSQESNEGEEHQKGLIKEFLQAAIGKEHYINTKERIDLAIYDSKDANSPVNILIETKSVKNKAEMPTKSNINSKALHELVLYYLRERVNENNIHIKHLIITNGLEWFIFDATVFENVFYKNRPFVNSFKQFEAKQLTFTNTDGFYKEIAKPFIDKLNPENIKFSYINLDEYDVDNIVKLKKPYKLFSKEHLLKLSFSNDSNSLNKAFYEELLYIIGLAEETKKKKKLIVRHKKNEGSLLEATIEQIENKDIINHIAKPNNYGITKNDRLFNIALELNITWLNRILFLKLLEAQLVAYHANEDAKNYSFLDIKKITNFDDLDQLFFQILAKQINDRKSKLEHFNYVPYLNSSLFEPTALERGSIYIGNLSDDISIPLYSKTVLKDDKGKKRKGSLTTLEYLFLFLDAYNFASEGTSEIENNNKNLINASVLGLIFEKINGYKDGSFFTPGYITMYMCRQTIRKSIIQKFNNHYDWELKSFNELYDKVEDKKVANQIINSLTIDVPPIISTKIRLVV